LITLLALLSTLLLALGWLPALDLSVDNRWACVTRCLSHCGPGRIGICCEAGSLGSTLRHVREASISWSFRVRVSWIGSVRWSPSCYNWSSRVGRSLGGDRWICGEACRSWSCSCCGSSATSGGNHRCSVGHDLRGGSCTQEAKNRACKGSALSWSGSSKRNVLRKVSSTSLLPTSARILCAWSSPLYRTTLHRTTLSTILRRSPWRTAPHLLGSLHKRLPHFRAWAPRDRRPAAVQGHTP